MLQYNALKLNANKNKAKFNKRWSQKKIKISGANGNNKQQTTNDKSRTKSASSYAGRTNKKKILILIFSVYLASHLGLLSKFSTTFKIARVLMK